MSNSLENMSISSADQPDDSGAESWSLLSASANTRELQCSICMHMMEKPHLVQCGHSFCFVCISQWLGNSSDCPVCRKMINIPMRNIALENVIEEYKKSHAHSKLSRTESLRKGILKSGQRVTSDDVVPLNAAFSPIIDSSRASTEVDKRRRISVNKAVRIHRPTDVSDSSSEGECSLSSSSGNQVHISDFRNHIPLQREQDSELSLHPQQFERFSAGRRTEFVPRRRQSSMLTGNVNKGDANVSDVSASPFQRSSRFRHSIGTTTCRENTSIANPGIHEGKETTTSSGVFSKKNFSSLIKKLVPFRMSFRVSKKLEMSEKTHFEKSMTDIPEITDELARLNMQLCVYSGVGKTFTRMYAGKEATVVVLGKKGVGKTTFLDNIAISIENNNGSASVVGQRQRLSWSVGTGQPTGNVAHLMSVMLPMDEHFVIDIIDSDDGEEDTLEALVKAADVIVVIYSTSDASSLLRIMAAVRLAERQKNPPNVVVIGNVFTGSHQKVVRGNMAKAITQNLNSSKMLSYETDLNQPNTDVIKILHDLSADVFARRNVAASTLDEVFVC